MTSIKRSPTPPGPITELFDRLDQLHLTAGRPSMREIAMTAGRGRISSSTVHNVFRASRVPRWNFLELIVESLHGDTETFRALWQEAWQAENMVEKHQAVSTEISTLFQKGLENTASVPSQRIWSPEIPSRNPNFTGRAAELEMLRANLIQHARPHPPAQIISGLGGIGKTEIATEYIHRHRDQYEIIWWIRADHHDRVRDALVELGQRVELGIGSPSSGRDRAIAAILESLQSGTRSSWLLVYDNAGQPLDLQRYLPSCPPGGHIIITSRLQNWPGYIYADRITVPPFTEDEAITFLRRRVPVLGVAGRVSGDEDEQRTAEAGRLAAALGHLPIAIEHAAAYLAETGQSVDDYLTRFMENAHGLLSTQPSDLPATVPVTWNMSTALLTPDARHLFNLCAFFSPEPIAAELFLQNVAITDPPGLGEFLSSTPRFRAAASQLHRLSLAKVDGARDQIQMHRVVQAVTRGQLRQSWPEMYQAYRSAVDTLLAGSNPNNPDLRSNDAIYDLSLPHLESDHSFLNTSSPVLRRLIIDQVRRLHLRGSQVEAVQFGQDALRAWRKRLERDDLQLLTLAVEVATAMRLDGHAADARVLTLETLALLQQRYGDQHEVTLQCASSYAADLRARSQFWEALELDLSLLPKFEHFFGANHEHTLDVQSSIAADYRRLGRFREALEIDERTYEGRHRILGSHDTRTLISCNAVARDKRDLGLYQESLDIARKAVRAFAEAGGRENPDWLEARTGFAVALRKAGYHWDALQESEDVVQRYRNYLGPDHMDTLRAATNLINDRREVGDLVRAEELGREVHDRCREAGFLFEIGFAVLVNLAAVLRAGGRADEARRYDLQAREGLIELYGELHPFTLAASINYAADLTACGDLAAAIRIGQDSLAKCKEILGESHPDTLMTAANLAIDEATSGNKVEADQLLKEALRLYEQTLTAEHPHARMAAQRTRLTAEIEPY